MIDLPPSKWDNVPPIDRFLIEMHECVKKVNESPRPKVVLMAPDLFKLVSALRGEGFTWFGLPAKPCKDLSGYQLLVATEEPLPRTLVYFDLDNMEKKEGGEDNADEG